ncbi:MAG: S8 family serine peptidase [Candidatus Woesearchaeota archaeon]
MRGWCVGVILFSLFLTVTFASPQYQGYIIELEEPPLVVAQAKAQQNGGLGIMGLSSFDEHSHLQTIQSQQDSVLEQVTALVSPPQQGIGILSVPEPIVPRFTYQTVFNGFSLDITDEQAKAIAQLNGVKRVHKNRNFELLLEESVPHIQNGIQAGQLDEDGNDCTITEKPCLTGKGVKIAIIDSGFDYTHPDLGGCTQQEFLDGECEKIIGGWHHILDSPDVFDFEGDHGTHVAATAAGNGTLKGVAPGASILAYTACTYSSCLESNIVAAMENAIVDGADILSLSLGLDTLESINNPATIAINNAFLANVSAVIGAGNSGSNNYTITSPGSSLKAITVGAVNKTNSLMSFSSRGPVIWFDENNLERITLKPDILAIGHDVNAAVPMNSYEVMEGTSMATPHVAGAIALLLEKHPSWTPQEIKDSIRATASDLGYTKIHQGAGLINVSALLQLNEPASYSEFYYYSPTNNSHIYAFSERIEFRGVFDENYDHINVSFQKEGDENWNTTGITIIGENNIFANLNATLLESGENYIFKINISYGELNFIEYINLDLFEDDDFYSGSGTYADPFVIVNCLQLQNINNYPENLRSHYILGSDIDCSQTANWNCNDGSCQGFKPIGNNSHRFMRTFDGNNYKIHNLTINSTDDNIGLFSITHHLTQIKNSKLKINSITGNERVGGLIGSNFGKLENSTVYVIGNITGLRKIGGVIGRNLGRVADSRVYVNGSVISKQNIAGGFIGSSYSIPYHESYVRNSTAIINGLVKTKTTSSAGGFMGFLADGILEYVNVTLNGKVNSNQNSAGGLVGSLGSGIVSNAIINITGIISSNQDHAGGIIGTRSLSNGKSPVTNISVFVSGNITAVKNAGGFIGYLMSDYLLSSTLNLTGNILSEESAGGAVGRNQYGNIVNITVYNSGFIGTTINYTGGLIGYNRRDMHNSSGYFYLNSSVFSEGRSGLHIGYSEQGTIENTNVTVFNSNGSVTFLDWNETFFEQGDVLKQINISKNYAYINSSNSQFNSSAILSLYGTGVLNGIIYRNNNICSPEICSIIDVNEDNYTFSVTGWSAYSIQQSYFEHPYSYSFSSDPRQFGWHYVHYPQSIIEEGGWSQPVATPDAYMWRSPQIEVEPFDYYKITVVANGTGNVHIVSLYYNESLDWGRLHVYDYENPFDTDGIELITQNWNIFNSSQPPSEIVTYEVIVQAPITANTTSIMIGGENVDFYNVTFEQSSKAELLTWTDSLYAQVPSLNYEPESFRHQYTPRTLEKLEEGDNVTIVLVGDSIMLDIGNSPLAEFIEQNYTGSNVKIISAVGSGTSIGQWNDSQNWNWPDKDLDFEKAILDYQPDMVIFGGVSNNNEQYATVPDAFEDIIDKVRYNISTLYGYDVDVVIMTGTNEANGNNFQEFAVPNIFTILQSVAEEKQTGFINLNEISQNYFLYSAFEGTSQEFFYRDGLHFNHYGKDILARIIAAWFSKDETEHFMYFPTMPENQTLTYGQVWEGVQFEVSSSLPIDTFWVNDTTHFTINQSGFLNWTQPLHVGEYYVNVSVNDTSGDSVSTIFNLNITQRSIEITADDRSKTFGDSDPTLTYQITSGSLAYGDTITGSLTRNTGESVGTYDITQGTLSIDNIENYDFTFIGGTFTINNVALTGTITGTTPISYGAVSDINVLSENVGDDDISYFLYRNEQQVFIPDITVLGAGTYNYVFNATGGQNYTANPSIDTFTLVVNQDTSPCTVQFNETSPVTYPQTFRVWSDCTSDFTLYQNETPITNDSVRSLEPGTYQFSVNRTDTQNYTQTFNQESFTIQSPGAPLITIISPENQVYTTNTIPLDITVTGEQIDTIWFYWNETNQTYEAPQTLIASDGEHTLTVWANNTLGQVSQEQVSFEVDTAVWVTILSPIEQLYTNTTILIEFNASESAQSIWYTWNGTNHTYEQPITRYFANGENTLIAFANSSSGIINQSTVTFTVNESYTPDAFTINSISIKPNISQSFVPVQVTLDIENTTPLQNITLDQKAFTFIEGTTWQVDTLAKSEFTLEVTENNQTYQQHVPHIIDNQPPITSLNASINSIFIDYTQWQNDSITIHLQASDMHGVNKTQYRFAGGSWQTYLEPFQVHNSTSLFIRSLDTAGNLELPQRYDFSIATIQPKITQVEPHTNVGKNTTFSTSFTIYSPDYEPINPQIMFNQTIHSLSELSASLVTSMYSYSYSFLSPNQTGIYNYTVLFEDIFGNVHQQNSSIEVVSQPIVTASLKNSSFIPTNINSINFTIANANLSESYYVLNQTQTSLENYSGQVAIDEIIDQITFNLSSLAGDRYIYTFEYFLDDQPPIIEKINTLPAIISDTFLLQVTINKSTYEYAYPLAKYITLHENMTPENATQMQEEHDLVLEPTSFDPDSHTYEFLINSRLFADGQTNLTIAAIDLYGNLGTDTFQVFINNTQTIQTSVLQRIADFTQTPLESQISHITGLNSSDVSASARRLQSNELALDNEFVKEQLQLYTVNASTYGNATIYAYYADTFSNPAIYHDVDKNQTYSQRLPVSIHQQNTPYGILFSFSTPSFSDFVLVEEYPQCTIGQQITEDCICAQSVESSGYCCASGHQSSSCSPPPPNEDDSDDSNGNGGGSILLYNPDDIIDSPADTEDEDTQPEDTTDSEEQDEQEDSQSTAQTTTNATQTNMTETSESPSEGYSLQDYVWFSLLGAMALVVVSFGTYMFVSAVTKKRPRKTLVKPLD